ncbi:MAG: Sensor protein [uncultured bacterium (gcode 4)]|uniref:histidine kinase n=1 Tax=uncultured bacterium (gcode 4) TaxID=1234023 RepID=K2ACZ0_9BACT|nr:MAG: Sensor protein [uncultured bacterium (gcode 4)]HBA44987.1 hypothetical protein [Candidatus Gracilibacteria bacterium]
MKNQGNLIPINDSKTSSFLSITQTILLWSFLIVGFAGWEAYHAYQFNIENALDVARDSHNKDLAYRRWGNEIGGVYVQVTEKTQPNPLLSGVPERDIITPSGKHLTLMNPAYMIRKVYDANKESYGLLGHITSLNPIRKENAPDSWETTVLQKFEKGDIKEYFSKEYIGNEEYLRYMRPILVDTKCLKCHAKQGYKAGDIRGGTSISVPLKPYKLKFLKNLFWIISLYGIILVLGIMYITLCHKKSLQNTRIRKEFEQKQQKLEERLHKIQKLESLGVLAGGIAHDFNNILMVIYGNCDMITMHPDPSLTSERVCQIRHAAKRASEICKNMLACTGKGSIKKKKIDLVRLVNDTIDLLKPKIEINISLNFTQNPEPLYTNGDIDQIQEVIMNLIINAIEAIGENKGQITVRLTQNGFSGKDYFEEDISPEKYICMEVSDTGCGMDEEAQKRIFEPFYTTKFTGRGLGISATLGIIKLHNGTLQLLSRPGVGTTFRIYLPALQEDEKLVVKTNSIVESKSNKKIK